MITAESAKLETRRSQENFIEELITDACKSGQDSITVQQKTLPGWLSNKLKEQGFIVQAIKVGPDETSMYKVYWGF